MHFLVRTPADSILTVGDGGSASFVILFLSMILIQLHSNSDAKVANSSQVTPTPKFVCRRSTGASRGDSNASRSRITKQIRCYPDAELRDLSVAGPQCCRTSAGMGVQNSCLSLCGSDIAIATMSY